MNAPTKLRMTADEFIAWALTRPEGEHYELVGGEVVRMAPQRAGHVSTKSLVWLALRQSVRAHGLPCEVFGDGLGVRIDESTFYQPDALVRCGVPLDKETMEIADPVIVVEVLSPSTESVDTGAKLLDYFRLPTMRHYLVVDDGKRSVIHYYRGAGEIEMHIRDSGPFVLDPPGLTVVVESFFED